MANLSDLREHIKSDLSIIGSTDYDAQIDNAIRSTLRTFLRGKRFWFLKTTDTVTLLTGTSSVALPADLSAPDAFWISDGTQWLGHKSGFEQKAYSDFVTKYANLETLQSGLPSVFAVTGTTLFTDRSAATDYTIRCAYWRKDSTLPSADSDTSVWFDDGYDVVRTRAMIIFKTEAEGFSVTPKDTSLADMYFAELVKQSQNMECFA